MKTIALSLLLAVVRSANVYDYDYGGGVVVGTPASDIGFAPPEPWCELSGEAQVILRGLETHVHGCIFCQMRQ